MSRESTTRSSLTVDIAGPHVLIDSEAAAGYPTATKAMLAGYVVKTASHLSLGLYMLWQNKKRDKQMAAAGELLPAEEMARKAEEMGMADMTDVQNVWHRYVL